MKVFPLLLALLCAFPVSRQMQAQDMEKVREWEEMLPEVNDSTKVMILGDLFYEFFLRDHERTRAYLDQQLEAARRTRNKSLIAYATNMNGVYYHVVSEFDRSMEEYEKAKDLYTELENRERVSAVMNNMANNYRQTGNLEKALSLQMESLGIKEAIGATAEAKAASYWNIGNLHFDIGNLPVSNEWYRKAEKVYEEEGLYDDLMSIRFNIAGNLADMDSLDAAMDTYRKAEKYYRENNLDNDLAGLLDQLGIIAKEQGKLDEAEAYYLEALELGQNNGEKTLPGILYRRLANLYMEKGEDQKALSYAQQALDVSKETGVKKKMITDYLVLANVYDSLGMYPEAYENYRQYHMLHDSILSEEKIAAMNELEVKYQTEKKEQEIQLLEEKAKVSRLRFWGLITGMIGLVLLFTAIYYGLRQKMKRNRLAREKLDQELAFSQKELEMKKKELMAFTLQLAQKNELLENIKSDVKEIKKSSNGGRGLQGVINTIEFSKNDNTSWENFRERFLAVHKDFESNAKKRFPEVTKNELRLMALMKLNLSSKEMASILNVSPEGIKKARYRLRKKLALETGDSLEDLVMLL